MLTQKWEEKENAKNWSVLRKSATWKHTQPQWIFFKVCKVFQPIRLGRKASWQQHKGLCAKLNVINKTSCHCYHLWGLWGRQGHCKPYQGSKCTYVHTCTHIHTLSPSEMQTRRGALSLVAQSHSHESALVSPAAFQITTTIAFTILGAQTELRLPLLFSLHNWYETNTSTTHTLWNHFDKTLNGPLA